VGEEYVVSQSALSKARSDLVDQATQFLMCLCESETECGRTVAVVGSHGRQSLRFRTSMPDAVRHRHAMLPSSDHATRRNGKRTTSKMGRK